MKLLNVRTTSAALLLSRWMSSTISSICFRSGDGDFSMILAVSALFRIAPSGWFISCAMPAAISPAVEKRLTCASSTIRCRASVSADRTAMPLEHEQRDQTTLKQEHRADGEDRPAVGLPDVRFAKENLTAWRQPRLADLPALKLAPVEEHLAAPRHHEAGVRIAAQNLEGERCGFPAVLCKAVHVAADEAAADILIDKAIDRHARRPGNLLHDLVRHEGMAGAISKKGRVEDDRAWRQLREFLQEVLHRQCGPISEGHAPVIRLELLFRRLEELEIDLRTAAHHHDILGRR